MVREEHFYFTSSEGTAKCHAVRWIPSGSVRAVVQIVHGMAEYIAVSYTHLRQRALCGQKRPDLDG